jgi:hypothetical protein
MWWLLMVLLRRRRRIGRRMKPRMGMRLMTVTTTEACGPLFPQAGLLWALKLAQVEYDLRIQEDNW